MGYEWEPQVFDLGNHEVLVNSFFPNSGKKPPYFYSTHEYTGPEQRDGEFKLVLINLLDLSKKQLIFDDSNVLVYFTRSPNKKFFIYTNQKNDIWIADKDGKVRMKAVFEKNINPNTIKWASDSKSFFFIDNYYNLYQVTITK